MLRKTILALIAVAAVGLGSATGASARGGGGGGHGLRHGPAGLASQGFAPADPGGGQLVADRWGELGPDLSQLTKSSRL